MTVARCLLLMAALPLFGGCQFMPFLKSDSPVSSTAGQTRMQGVLMGTGGQLIFQPCNEPRRYFVTDAGNTGVLQEAADLANVQGQVFADLRGRFDASSSGGTEGQLSLQRVYRLERSAAACKDAHFKQTSLVASGEKPTWRVTVGSKGMVVEREGQPQLALPYMEEQVGDGRFNLSSEANGQRVELWIAPQRCVDPVTDAVQFHSAELRVNDQVQQGCAYLGGARND